MSAAPRATLIATLLGVPVLAAIVWNAVTDRVLTFPCSIFAAVHQWVNLRTERIEVSRANNPIAYGRIAEHIHHLDLDVARVSVDERVLIPVVGTFVKFVGHRVQIEVCPDKFVIWGERWASEKFGAVYLDSRNPDKFLRFVSKVQITQT